VTPLDSEAAECQLLPAGEKSEVFEIVVRFVYDVLTDSLKYYE